MRSFVLAATLMAAAAAGLPAASAAPKPPPPCRQVTDAAGDAKAYGNVAVPGLDILSADIASGRRTFVAAVRLASFDRHQIQATGSSIKLFWTVGGRTQSVGYHVYATGEVLGRFDADATTSELNQEIDVPFVADPSTSTISWTLSRGMLDGLKKPGAKFTGLRVDSAVSTNTRLPMGMGEGRNSGNPTDTASTIRSYVDGSATCLKAS